MAAQLFLALCITSFLGLSSALFTLPKLQVPQVIIFGDSLSDNGNTFQLFNGTYPSPQYYWQGRFTNAPGPWADQVKNALTLVPGLAAATVTNYAYGAATACTYQNITGKRAFIPSMQQMVAKYVAQPLKPGKKVIVLWGGHNDMSVTPQLPLKQALAFPAKVVACLDSMASSILKADKDAIVLVGALAPLQLTPWLRSVPVISKLVGSMNTALRASTAILSLKHKSRAAYWDINALLATNIKNSTSLGFPKGANSSCLEYTSSFEGLFKNFTTSISRSCTDPQDYCFYDKLHPTSEAHSFITRDFFKMLVKAKAVLDSVNTLLQGQIGFGR